eukprot:354371-Chlamydomonas_euryale.AAC.4
MQNNWNAGVSVTAVSIDWSEGQATLGKQLPVMFSPLVKADDIDKNLLERVFEFNANDPRKPPRKGQTNKAAKTKS